MDRGAGDSRGRGHHAKGGPGGSKSHSPRHDPGVVPGSDVRPRQRLFEDVVLRLRHPCEERRRTRGDRHAGSRRPVGRCAGQAEFGAGSGQCPQGRAAVRRLTYKRWRESPKGVVSEQETESKQADYGTAMARLNSANAEVAADQGEVDRLNALEGFKKIIAPFDGVVTARETDIGALINAGSGTSNGPELFRMADVSKMRIFVQVPQQQSAGIAPGQEAELHLPQYPGRTFKATVATTSNAIDMEAR